MGDRTYARISIPARLLADLQVKAVVTEILGASLAEIDAALSAEPEPDEAGYDNGVSLRLVEGVPCLVYEDDQANYGGAAEEEALVRALVPYLLVHGDGGEYSGGAAAFDGQRRSEVELNRQDEIVVQVDTSTARPRVRPGHLAKVRSYLAIRRAVLRSKP